MSGWLVAILLRTVLHNPKANGDFIPLPDCRPQLQRKGGLELAEFYTIE